MPSLFNIQLHIWGDAIAFSFAIAAIILCSIQIHHHIYHSHDPDTRRHIIRILLMVIVYSIESWMGLYAPGYGLYLDLIRDTYESLVIYSFYQLLVQSMGGYDSVQSFLYMIPDRAIRHPWPVKWCCNPWYFSEDLTLSVRNKANSGTRGFFGYYNSTDQCSIDGDDRNHHDQPNSSLSVSSSSSSATAALTHRRRNGTFLRNCSWGVLQYCVLQTVCACVTFLMTLTGTYGESKFQWDVGYPYICTIRSISQTIALYCLALFYLALTKQSPDSDGYAMFEQIRPVPKFLAIKGIVFFTYWQSVGIAILVWIGWLKETGHWNQDDIAVGIQDFLICVEMLFAAIAHIYAFRVNDFQESSYAPLLPVHRVIFDVANVGDVASEAKEALKDSVHDLNTKLKRKKIKSKLRGPVAISQARSAKQIHLDGSSSKENPSNVISVQMERDPVMHGPIAREKVYGVSDSEPSESVALMDDHDLSANRIMEPMKKYDETAALCQDPIVLREKMRAKAIKHKKRRYRNFNLNETQRAVQNEIEDALSDDEAL